MSVNGYYWICILRFVYKLQFYSISLGMSKSGRPKLKEHVAAFNALKNQLQAVYEGSQQRDGGATCKFLI